MKKCRPVVKEPSGGTLLFRCALPARGASSAVPRHALQGSFASALPARGASDITTESARDVVFASALPARGASDHHSPGSIRDPLCLGAACTGCIGESRDQHGLSGSLPRRCLHGVHPPRWKPTTEPRCFASALPARGASLRADHCGREVRSLPRRCLHGVHQRRSSR